jgi:hypothetical protein
LTRQNFLTCQIDTPEKFDAPKFTMSENIFLTWQNCHVRKVPPQKFSDMSKFEMTENVLYFVVQVDKGFAWSVLGNET